MLKPRFESGALEEKEAFRDALVRWFGKNGRDYPWRRTQDPHAVLVSEVMLQQTQIATVLGKGYFARFLEKFPDVRALAASGEEELLKVWEGLGYYRRARMLRETARAVVERHGGIFPNELEALMDLPGIGRYTAGAVRAFAFGLPAVVVDGNVIRVLARLFDFRDEVDSTAGLKRIWAWAEELADAGQPQKYHAGLMELGQTICRPGVPNCLDCPVGKFCRAESPEVLPQKGRKISVTEVEEHALWCQDADGRILLHRESGSRRTGLWKLPVRSAEELGSLPILTELNYTITRYRVRLFVHEAEKFPEELLLGDAWVGADEALELALAAPFRKAMVRILEG